MPYVLESKQENGKTKEVFVLKQDTIPKPEEQSLNEKLMHQVMKDTTEDLINTIREVGGTDGKGGSANAGTINDSSNPAKGATQTQVAAQNAVQEATKAVESAQAAVNKAQAHVDYTKQVVDSSVSTLTDLMSRLKAAQTEQANLYIKVKDTYVTSDQVNNDQLKNNAISIENLQTKTDFVDHLQKQIKFHTNVYDLVSVDHYYALKGLSETSVNLKEAQQKVEAVGATDSSGDLKSANSSQGVKGSDPSSSGGNDPASDPAQKDMHKFLKDHNVFWDLLMVSMKGNSSVYGILTQSLGKISNLLTGNQYVTGILTQINNDLQKLINLPAPKDGDLPNVHEMQVLTDLQKQLELLQNIENPDRSNFYYPPGTSDADKKKLKAQAEQANQGFSDVTKNQLSELLSGYTGELKQFVGTTDKSDGPAGYLQYMMDVMYGKGPNKDNTYNGSISQFKKFFDDMTAQSGQGTGKGASGIFSQNSSFITSLNTAGSQFMAQQNLATKQVDQTEKLWTSGMSTDKSILQSIIGNVSN